MRMTSRMTATRARQALLPLLVGAALLTMAPGIAGAREPDPVVAVGAQYDTTHVYVPADEFDRFVSSVIATFGGTASKLLRIA